ncbi:MAG TPA: asparagine synthase-related protein, partial [Paludibacter sp.]|nr:asparagine synthase-related protein [Paludibacter sp.]
MNGFIIILSSEKNITPDIPIYWKKPFDFQSKFVHRKQNGGSYQIEQFSSQKLEKEKLWIDTDDFIFITEGVIHNIHDLCKKNNSINAESLITKYYQTNNNTFFSLFEGNYSGFLFDKHRDILTTFNNKTGMKRVFYFHNSQYTIFASDLKTLCHSLNQLKIHYSLNVESAYLLLTSGFMHENLTLIDEVKQLRAGEYCLYKNNIIQIHSYFNLKDISETNDSKKTIIENLDGLFTEAVRLEFEIDKSNGLKHLTTLSGGLDSRMTALISYKAGYRDQILLNFSQKGYADEIIAKQIAKKFQIPLIQKELNEQSLIAIDDVVSVNDGLTLYSACSHAYDALKQTQHSETGMIHT